MVRESAARTLGKMGTAAAKHAGAIARLTADSDEFVRVAAVEALGHMGPAGAREVAGLLADASQRIREAAVKALGNMGPAAAEHAEAVSGLLKSNSTKVFPPDCSFTMLLHGENVLVREPAVKTLRKMGPAGAQGLTGLLADADPCNRLHAVEQLGQMGPLAAPHADIRGSGRLRSERTCMVLSKTNSQ